MNLKKLRKNAFTDHMVIRIIFENHVIFLINFMTTLRDAAFVDQNLIKLKLFIEKQTKLFFNYNVVFCLIESKQVMKRGKPITMDPPTFLSNNFPNLDITVIPYNKTSFSMNSIILGCVDSIKILKTEEYFILDEHEHRSFPVFTLNSQEFIFGHAYFPRSLADVDIKIKHLALLNRYAVQNNAIAFGDGNISVYNQQDSIDTISSGLNLTLLKSFFGTDRDKYARDNIKSEKNMSSLDFVASPFKIDLDIEMIEPL